MHAPTWLAQVKKEELLSKYDEEIHGEKKKAFVLGSFSSLSQIML